MALIRWNPDYVSSPFDRLFNTFFDRSEDRVASFVPGADISETDEAVTLTMDLPGLAKNDVKIAVENGVLSISGERKQSKKESKTTYHLQESSYGSFLRRFTLGDDIDETKVNAAMDKGVLHITLPKKESSKPKKIEIAIQ